jgi:hypothetical protein
MSQTPIRYGKLILLDCASILIDVGALAPILPGYVFRSCRMKLSLPIAIVAAVVTSSAAMAASVTIDFPVDGDAWADIASGTTGTVSGGYTGQLSSAGSYVTSSGSTYASLQNFVATSFSATFNINNTQFNVINYSIGGDTVDIPLTDCCGTEQYTTGIQTLPFSVLLSSTSPITYTLDNDMPSGHYIEFGTGTVTLYGAYATPEPSTWAMLLLGFGGLGFAGYRKVKGARIGAA